MPPLATLRRLECLRALGCHPGAEALALLLTLCLALPAQAQKAITAYGGVRSGSGFQQAGSTGTPIDMSSSGAASVAIEWPLDASRQLQLLVSQQRTRLDIGSLAGAGAPNRLPLRLSYVHIGGLNFFDGPVGRGPYVAGGLGLTLLSPNLDGLSSRVRASMNLGLGYQWPLGASLALRTELRAYATLIRSDGSFFCSGGCVISIKGDTLNQVEAMAGLTFGF